MLNNILYDALNLYDAIDWIIITDRKGIIEYSAIYDREEKEYKNENTAGMHILAIYPDLKEEESSILKVLKTGKPVLYEHQELRDFRGNHYHILNSTVPILEKGKVIGAIEVSRFMEDQQTEKKPSGKREASLEDIITRDPGMLEVKEKILRVAGTDSPVLITGETGTGKELVAQSIHYHGGRNRGAFVTLNCAAVPESLLESLLFGTVKGAFTGAENKQGLISGADKGVLFLDEIHMMPLGLQAKLLRFLEDYRVRRVGDTEERPVDVRIISAMNVDPMEAMEKNQIRQDLFYRLSVVSIRLPSLKDRPADIPVLTDHFIGLYNKKMNRSIKGVSELVMNLFMDFPWKGNVRELKHVIEGAFNLAKGDVITLKDLPEHMVNIKNPLETNEFPAGESLGLEDKVNEYEKTLIRSALTACATQAEAARKLGITRQSLRYKIEKHHINQAIT